MPKKKTEGQLVKLPSLKIKFKDIFDLKDFYVALHEWMLEHQWKDKEEGNDHWESLYYEMIRAGGAKEMWLWWRLFKPAPEASYLSYYLDLDFHVIGLTDMEVIKDGKKIKTNKGEVEISLNSFLELKYTSKFAEHPFLKFFEGMFTRRIYSSKTEREKELYQEVYALNNYIRQWFKLKRYLPYEETKPFFQPKALPSHLKETE